MICLVLDELIYQKENIGVTIIIFYFNFEYYIIPRRYYFLFYSYTKLCVYQAKETPEFVYNNNCYCFIVNKPIRLGDHTSILTGAE